MNIVDQLKTGKARIEYLLEHYPSLRDNDKKLWISYLVMFHNLQDVLLMPKPFDALCDLLLIEDVIQCESIRRLRQKIQEQGLYQREPQSNLHRVAFNVKSRVEHLLKNYPALRDHDVQLWLSYLVMYHGLKDRVNEAENAYEEFCDIILDKDVTSMESIRRTRQAFQENSLYVGTKRQERLLAAKKVAKLIRK
jgi:uncharacterized protein (DUF433 family)